MTNYEKIKSMSIEECEIWLRKQTNYCFACGNDKTHKNCPLIEFCFNQDHNFDCADKLTQWLESEATEK